MSSATWTTPSKKSSRSISSAYFSTPISFWQSGNAGIERALATTVLPIRKSPPAIQDREFSFPLPSDFAFEAGCTLPGAVIQARLVGPAHGPVVLTLGGISANRHACPSAKHNATGWWSDFVGEGLAVDTNKFQVLSFDFLPENSAQPKLDSEGKPGQAVQKTDVPAPFTITTADHARIARFICQQLHIKRLHAFVGASYGGMIALSFAQQFPELVSQVAVLCAAHRPHPMGLAWRSIQRKLVRFGLEIGEPDRALSLARELGMTTYRTPEEFGERFATCPSQRLSETPSAVESYLETRGQAFIGTMSPQRYLSLSHSIDSHYVDPKILNVPLTLIGCRQDQLVPIEELRLLAASTKGKTNLIEFDSHYGHDAFLKEPAIITDALTAVLSAGGN